MAVMERDLVRQDAATLARAMSDGEVSSEEITRAHLGAPSLRLVTWTGAEPLVSAWVRWRVCRSRSRTS